MKIKAEGKTEFERFDNVMKKMLSVPKEEMDRRIAADPRGHPKKKRLKRVNDHGTTINHRPK